MKQTSVSRTYYPALDGMRGLAILLVVVYHNFNFINYSYFGWLGVDLFFVLSGFLITNILLQDRNKPHFLRNFFLRRALRIFPLYFFTLFLFLVVLPLLFQIPGITYYIDNQIWLWFYLQNWLFIFNPPPANSLSLAHLWSLGVEEQFYLLWPFAILTLKKGKSILTFTVCLLLSVIALRFYLWVNRIESISYYNLYTFTRIDGICIGCILAVLRKVASDLITKYFTVVVLSLAALNFLFYFFNRHQQYVYPYMAIAGYSTFAALFGLLVNEGISPKNFIIRTVFKNRILVFLGKISFSFYVFHLPIYILFRPKMTEWLHTRLFSHMELLTSSILTLAAFGISVLSFYFFERRFLKLKNSLAY